MSESYSFGGPAAEEGCRAALAACLAKGWLQVIDEPTLAAIAAELREGRFLGPIYGFPLVGRVDFTHAGAELWQRLSRRWSRNAREAPFAYTDVVHEKTTRYFRTRAAAVAEIEETKSEDDLVSVSGPSPTGPWRAQWWRRFPEGHRIDIEERMQWQGRGSGGGEECHLYRCPQRADPLRLRQILDRHNVTFAEWVLLEAMEDGPRRFEGADFQRLAESAGREFGATISEEEYRGGLEACLRYGWLRVLDRNVVDEVHALLRDDPAVLAVPKTAELRPEGCCYSLEQYPSGNFVPVPMPAESRWGEIDFTPTGAALYRMISGEWLGPDWEDDLRVSNRYYWEEHRYCESEAGFQGIVPEYLAKGDVVRATRVGPIGPWCVYWWERFPAGYRMEIEVGEP